MLRPPYPSLRLPNGLLFKFGDNAAQPPALFQDRLDGERRPPEDPLLMKIQVCLRTGRSESMQGSPKTRHSFELRSLALRQRRHELSPRGERLGKTTVEYLAV